MTKSEANEEEEDISLKWFIVKLSYKFIDCLLIDSLKTKTET